jgi:soluble P-type ATPase
MQTIPIPDFGILTLATIVCDYNGTLALDGVLWPGVKEAINRITDIDIHVITVSNPKRFIAMLRS